MKRLGAIGIVSIMNPRHMDIPWERAALARFMPSMSLADPAMDETRGMKLAVTINPPHADKLLAGSGHTFEEILAAANSDKPLPHFAIPARLKATVAVKHADVVSQNVVAMLPGSDPKLKDEYVVCTAHLDHLGIGKPINGDAIYNGAMDNASGIAAMLDVAAMLKESGTKLRRSVLFVAVTAEEKGLLGSKFFANAPTVDPKAIVANLNTDMFMPLFPLKKLTIYGMDESDLGAEAAAAAESMGVQPQRDPEPFRNVFIRSDQYSFIRRGVPALALKVGLDKGSPEEQIQKKWLTERYHAPSDDVAQPVDKQAAGAFDVLVARLLERIANRETRPRWKESSFFKRFAGMRPAVMRLISARARLIVRAVIFSTLGIGVVFVSYLVLLCHPRLFFRYAFTRGGITLYSDEPIPPEAAGRVPRRCRAPAGPQPPGRRSPGQGPPGLHLQSWVAVRPVRQLPVQGRGTRIRPALRQYLPQEGPLRCQSPGQLLGSGGAGRTHAQLLHRP